MYIIVGEMCGSSVFVVPGNVCTYVRAYVYTVPHSYSEFLIKHCKCVFEVKFQDMYVYTYVHTVKLC